MVLGVCRRVLHGAPDVDDAFQATFLVLLRKAGSIVRRESVGSWLYGVAYRIAVRTRLTTQRQHHRQRQMADMPTEVSPEDGGRELRSVLDQELLHLPPKYRAPLVLHYLEGKTKEQTARELGWTEGTVSGRLARARELLRGRLIRRGLALPAGAVLVELSRSAAPAAMPAALSDATLRAAVSWLTGGPGAAVVSSRVVGLVEDALRSLLLTKLKFGAVLLLALGLMAAGGMAAHQLFTAKPSPVADHQPAPRRASDATEPRLAKEAQTRHVGPGDPLPAGALVRLGSNRGRHVRDLTAVAFAPNGKLFATRARDEMVRVWDTATGKEVAVLRGDPAVPWSGFWDFAFAPNGKTLATGGGDGLVRFWAPLTGKQLRQIRTGQSDVRALAYSGNGRLLATGSEDGQIAIWDLATRGRLRRFGPGGPRLHLHSLAFSPDNKTLATVRGGFIDKSVISVLDLDLWDATQGDWLGRLAGRENELPRVVFSSDGQRLAWPEQGSVCVRDVSSLKVIRRLPGNRDGWHGFAFTDGGRTLAVASHSGVRIWDIATGKQLRSFGCPGRILCLALTRDNATLAAGTADGAFHLWKVRSGKLFPRPGTGHQAPVNCVAYSPDGKTLATSSQDGTIHLCRAADGKEIRRWPAHALADRISWPNGLAFSRDGNVLASGGRDGMVRLWNLATGKELRHFPEAKRTQGGYSCLDFSPDGKWLATRDDQGAVRRWTPTGREVRRLQPGDPQDYFRLATRALAFSPNGKYLASPRGGLVRVWEVATGTEIATFAGRNGTITAVAFSPDSRSLAAATHTGELCLWDLATAALRSRVALPPAVGGNLNVLNLLGRMPAGWFCLFSGLVFTADGKNVLGGRDDGHVYLWDLAMGRLVRTPAHHREDITFLALSPDGKKLATASADTTVLVWDVAALVKAGQAQSKRRP
jgi:RNA polymerase sigma factor (sigma-70 family)